MKTSRTYFSAIFAVLFFTITQGCMINGVNTERGDGNVEARSYEIDMFDSIELGGSFSVVLTEGEEESLTIETDQNLFEYLNVKSENNVLDISSDRDIVLRPTKLEVHITYTSLEKVSVSGACKLMAETTIRSESFTLNISGAGAGELDIVAETLTTDISGAASLTITGRATNHKASLSGASSLKAEELVTESTDISLSGAGSATVYAAESINAKLSGVGSIKYAGNPEKKQTNVSGIGKISSIE